ncbi:hypothetical protein GQ44DRAFT_774360 [Phaeosphaeriaceae sp. PMI808]|nr:hypothetical protein GQ44DRAFT_774360 [Phaeosphaeriaceae sp. PMI808]
MEHPKAYPKAMKYFHSLYAVWSPDQTGRIKPGACGYFDDSGDWNTIANLRDIKADDASFLKPPQIPEPIEKFQGRWPPICSDGVSWAQMQLDVPIPIPDADIKFEAKIEFTKQKGYGASLVTGPNVSSTYLENPKAIFQDWIKANYTSIRDRYPDIKDHGLWIITKTYHTRRCAISSWSGLEQSACLYVGAGALVGNSLTLQGAIGETKQSGIWRFFSEKSKNKKDRNIGYTVFVGGLRYQSSILGLKEVPVTAPMRGKEEDEFLVDSNDGPHRIVCEDWGTEDV